MRIIQKLADMIDEELEDAMKYAYCYMAHKDDDVELAKTFSQLSYEELTHADRLHTQVVRLIKIYRDENGDPPPAMQARYDYLHERQIEKANRIRVLLA